MKLKKLAAALLVASAAFSGSNAQAAPINVGGVIFDPNSFFDFNSSSNIYETTAFQAGETISGYGKITQINGESDNNVFCPSCQITYSFGGFTLLDLNIADPTTGIATNGEFAFTGGWLNVYVDKTSDVGYSPFNSLVKASAENGTLWLGLVGSDGGGVFGPGYNLRGTATGTSSLGLTGQGVGYFDVLGGVLGGTAGSYINTNSQPGGSDLTYSSSFQPLVGPIVNGGQTVATHFGTNELYGNSVAVPEPTSIALLGLGLLGLGFSRRNKKSA